MMALDPRPCTRAEMDFWRWSSARPVFARDWKWHRKLWEWLVVAECFRIARPERALGFGVGCEPLVAWMASQGCQVTATDCAPKKEWIDTGQHCGGDMAKLYHAVDHPYSRHRFPNLIKYREVDMWAIPDDLRDFDFVWSCCALEHLGGLKAGADFVVSSLASVRPGGVAVHTTEFNVNSTTDTIENEDLCVYRRGDLVHLIDSLRPDYWIQRIDWNRWHPDSPGDPDPQSDHLTFRLGGFDLTSFVLPIVVPR